MSRYGIFTARCGKPRKMSRLIKALGLEIKAHNAQFAHSMIYRKTKGPYLENGQVCFDYEYEPMERD
jgi:hypothetical protein